MSSTKPIISHGRPILSKTLPSPPTSLPTSLPSDPEWTETEEQDTLHCSLAGDSFADIVTQLIRLGHAPRSEASVRGKLLAMETWSAADLKPLIAGIRVKRDVAGVQAELERRRRTEMVVTPPRRPGARSIAPATGMVTGKRVREVEDSDEEENDDDEEEVEEDEPARKRLCMPSFQAATKAATTPAKSKHPQQQQTRSMRPSLLPPPRTCALAAVHKLPTFETLKTPDVVESEFDPCRPFVMGDWSNETTGSAIDPFLDATW